MPNMNERVEEVSRELREIYTKPVYANAWEQLAKHVLRREIEAEMRGLHRVLYKSFPHNEHGEYLKTLQSQLEEI